MIKTGGVREIVFFPTVLALFCLGPPAQADLVQKTLGSTSILMVPMSVDVSVTPAVFNTGPASSPLMVTAVTMFDRYMRTEIPVALPPARAVIELRTAPFYLNVWTYGGSRASPTRLDRYFNLKRVLRA